MCVTRLATKMQIAPASLSLLYAIILISIAKGMANPKCRYVARWWISFLKYVTPAEYEKDQRDDMLRDQLQISEIIQRYSRKPPAAPVTGEPEFPYPLSKTEEVVVEVVRDLGCLFIIVGCGASLLASLFMRDFSTERLFHTLQEIFTIIEHTIMISPLRKKLQNVIHLCYLSALSLQFCSVVTFALLFLESLHNYAVIYNIIFTEDMFSMPTYILGAFLFTALIYVSSAVWLYDFYPSRWRCWVNYDSRAVLSVYLLSVLSLGAGAMILAESAGMFKASMVIAATKQRMCVVRVNRVGVLILVPLYLTSEIVASVSIHQLNIVLIGLVAPVNMALGFAIFLLHTAGNAKVQKS